MIDNKIIKHTDSLSISSIIILLIFMLIWPNYYALEPLSKFFQSPVFAVLFILTSLLFVLSLLAIVNSTKWLFICLSPIALFAIPYAYSITLYNSIVGIAFIEVAIGTTLQELYGLTQLYNIYLLAPLFYFFIYIYIALKIDSAVKIKKEVRQTIILLSVMLILLGVLSKQHLNSEYKINKIINQSLILDSYPLGTIIKTANVILREPSKKLDYIALNLNRDQANTKKETIVLVIGESVRGQHLSINGYQRPTTKHIESLGDSIVSFKDVTSYANSTHQSVPRLMTFQHNENQRYSLIQTFKEAGFSTSWISNQVSDIFQPDADVEEFADSMWSDLFRKDEDMLPIIQSAVNQNGDKQFIVIHMLGSHMNYDSRYTQESTLFMPRYADISAPLNSDIAHQALINSYDNSIVALDQFLNQVIKILEKDGGSSHLIFTSDHGENLFDDERKLSMHSSPTPSRYEVDVPLLVWCSTICMEQTPDLIPMLNTHKNKSISHKNVFPTILSIAQFQLPQAIKDYSILSEDYTATTRWVYPTPNEQLMVSELH